MSNPGGPVACFSYLAAASLWKVVQFPAANDGAEICAIDESIAADGAMVAAVLVGLGSSSLLLANNVGDNGSGVHVLNWLRDCGVSTTAHSIDGIETPQVVVVGDSHHTRTFFPYLPGVADELEGIELPRVLRTREFAVIYAVACIPRRSSMTSCGVRYPSAEWIRLRL
jgi:sugar/nucleoside kinase (ribokinase family)